MSHAHSYGCHVNRVQIRGCLSIVNTYDSEIARIVVEYCTEHLFHLVNLEMLKVRKPTVTVRNRWLRF